MIKVSLLDLVCQKANVRYPVMPGPVKTRVKELDNNEMKGVYLSLLDSVFRVCQSILESIKSNRVHCIYRY